MTAGARTTTQEDCSSPSKNQVVLLGSWKTNSIFFPRVLHMSPFTALVCLFSAASSSPKFSQLLWEWTASAPSSMRSFPQGDCISRFVCNAMYPRHVRIHLIPHLSIVSCLSVCHEKRNIDVSIIPLNLNCTDLQHRYRGCEWCLWCFRCRNSLARWHEHVPCDLNNGFHKRIGVETERELKQENRRSYDCPFEAPFPIAMAMERIQPVHSGCSLERWKSNVPEGICKSNLWNWMRFELFTQQMICQNGLTHLVSPLWSHLTSQQGEGALSSFAENLVPVKQGKPQFTTSVMLGDWVEPTMIAWKELGSSHRSSSESIQRALQLEPVDWTRHANFRVTPSRHESESEGVEIHFVELPLPRFWDCQLHASAFTFVRYVSLGNFIKNNFHENSNTNPRFK